MCLHIKEGAPICARRGIAPQVSKKSVVNLSIYESGHKAFRTDGPFFVPLPLQIECRGLCGACGACGEVQSGNHCCLEFNVLFGVNREIRVSC